MPARSERYLHQLMLPPIFTAMASFLSIFTLDKLLIFCRKFRLTLITWVWLQQPQEQRYPVLQVHDGSFLVSVIHQTPTWTTRSFTCVHDNSYTHGGWAHRQQGSTTFLTLKNSLRFFFLCPWQDSNSGLWSLTDLLSHLCHPIIKMLIKNKIQQGEKWLYNISIFLRSDGVAK